MLYVLHTTAFKLIKSFSLIVFLFCLHHRISNAACYLRWDDGDGLVGQQQKIDLQARKNVQQ